MDIYTVNGNILREFPRDDGTTELELEFLFDDLFWTRLFSMTIYYVAFWDNLKINYVQSKHSYTRAVVKQSDFNEEVKEELVKTLLLVKENSILLRALADKLLFNQPEVEDVETNNDKDLISYKVAEVRGKKFLSAFADELKKKSVNFINKI